MTGTLEARITAALSRPVQEPVREFAEALARDAGALAVLFYGSNLRTGSLEGVLDFYLLLDGPVETGIWPRVSYHEREIGGVMLRAKVATMALATFREAAAGALLDTTIWARFVQPSTLIWARDEVTVARIGEAIGLAACTAARLAVALGPEAATPDQYWRALFRATYAAEFRVEKAGREESILAVNREHFDGLLAQALSAADIAFARDAQGGIRPEVSPAQRRQTLNWWRRRRRMGKSYNLVRLLRASTTFDGAARYAAWKIERHTGVPVPLTPWRERHPVLAAPGVLWRLWRAKRGMRPAGA